MGQEDGVDSFPTHCSSLSQMGLVLSPEGLALVTDRALPH